MAFYTYVCVQYQSIMGIIYSLQSCFDYLSITIYLLYTQVCYVSNRVGIILSPWFWVYASKDSKNNKVSVAFGGFTIIQYGGD